MKCPILTLLWPVVGILFLASMPVLAEDTAADQAAMQPTTDEAVAEEPAAQEATATEPAAQPNADDAKKIPARRSPYRRLAPGVMQTVDPMRSLGETVSRHNVTEILAIDPALNWAKDVSFRHDVWTLDFEFKPVRLLWVDEPNTGGHMQRKLIWYMVYSVTNPGKVLHPVEDEDLAYKDKVFEKKQLYRVIPVDQPVKFLPEFLMSTYQRRPGKKLSNKTYPDRVIPVAMAAIQLREDPNRRFLTTVEMCREIGVGETVWGIATWEDIDLETFRFSVYVSGLTNAYRWRDIPGEYKAGDPVLKGRKFTHRTLKLNFWRPADKYFEHEEEIHYGTPGGIDYEWVYR